MALLCPAGHATLRAFKEDYRCSCGDVHVHMQLECTTCGHVEHVHPVNQDTMTKTWNDDPDNTERLPENLSELPT